MHSLERAQHPLLRCASSYPLISEFRARYYVCKCGGRTLGLRNETNALDIFLLTKSGVPIARVDWVQEVQA